MTQDEIMAMARQVGFPIQHFEWQKAVEEFTALVEEKTNARANASWTLMCKKMLDIEREACAKDAEWCIQNHLEHLMPERIRARKETP